MLHDEKVAHFGPYVSSRVEIVSMSHQGFGYAGDMARVALGVGSVRGTQQVPTGGQMPLRRRASSFTEQMFTKILGRALSQVMCF